MNDFFAFDAGQYQFFKGEGAKRARPILLGTRTFDTASSIHLFSASDLVKHELERYLSNDLSRDSRIHPSALELRAAITTISFFEQTAAQHDERQGIVSVIEHDNWHRIFWTFVHLFEDNRGFLAKWKDEYRYMPDRWASERRYTLRDVRTKQLEGNCGKSYSAADGTPLLEYVDKIFEIWSG